MRFVMMLKMMPCLFLILVFYFYSCFNNQSINTIVGRRWQLKIKIINTRERENGFAISNGNILKS